MANAQDRNFALVLKEGRIPELVLFCHKKGALGDLDRQIGRELDECVRLGMFLQPLLNEVLETEIDHH